MLADLRRRGFSLARLRRLLVTLAEVFGVRLFEALGEGGALTLFIDGDRIFARTADGRFFNLSGDPTQPLLVVGDGPHLRELRARDQNEPRRTRRTRRTRSTQSTHSTDVAPSAGAPNRRRTHAEPDKT